MTPKGKIILVVGLIVVALGVTGAILYKRNKKKKAEIEQKAEEEKAVAETPKPYDIIKELVAKAGYVNREVKDVFFFLYPDKTRLTFYKNNRVTLHDKSGKLANKGTYADGGKTKPSIKIIFDDGKTMNF
jgi:hypothetical protein